MNHDLTGPATPTTCLACGKPIPPTAAVLGPRTPLHYPTCPKETNHE